MKKMKKPNEKQPHRLRMMKKARKFNRIQRKVMIKLYAGSCERGQR